MASQELQRLWRLAEIDRQIVELRHRAAALDIGQRQQAEIEKLNASHSDTNASFKALQQKIVDLELAQKGDDAKRAKIQKEIYGGKVINPREVANLEKEVDLIKKKQDSEADILLELYDQFPTAKATHDAFTKRISELEAAREDRKKHAVTDRTNIEVSFKQLSAKRPAALQGIPPGLLSRYENIRQHHGGIGMVEVSRKTGSCGGCGTNLPDRTFVMLREDKTAICESCHRLLYYTEGVV